MTASTFTTVQFMDPPGGPGGLGAIKAGSGISISADGTISATSSGGVVQTITGTNGIVTAGTTNVLVSLNPPTSTTLGGVRTVDGSGISIDSQGVIRSAASYTIFSGAGIQVSNVTPISSTVAVTPATQTTIGGVSVPANGGLTLSAGGALGTAPATAFTLGTVKVGTGLAITPDGTLTTASGTGTITSVIAGTGLSGGGTSGAVTLNLLPGTTSTIGGVKQGAGCAILPDGTLNIVATSPTLQIVTDNGATTNKLITITGPEVGGYTNEINNALIRFKDSGGTSILDIDARVPRVLVSNLLSLSVTGGIANIGTLSSGGALRIRAGTGIQFTDEGFATVWGTINGTGLNIPTSLTVAGNVFPTNSGTNGQVLTTDGAGTLSWQNGGAGTAPTLQQVTTAGNTTTDTVIVGKLGVGTPTPAYPVQVAGDIGSFGPNNLWTMNSTSGQAQIILQNNGVNGTLIRDDATGSTDIITYGASLRLGANGVEKLQLGTDGSAWLCGDIVAGTPAFKIDGTTGQVTINANAAGTLTFPTSVGAAGQVMVNDGSGNLYWASNFTSNALYSTTGSIVYASAPDTPATLNIGGAGTILGVFSGLPAWRTAAQLNLLTTVAASTTYAPKNTPTFTGPVTINAGLPVGGNALIVNGGNLIQSQSYTPGSQGDVGSTGEIAWDNSYIYVCVSDNFWGRVPIDLTPF